MRSETPRQEKTKRSSLVAKTPLSKPPSRRDRKRADIIAAAKEVFFAEGYAASMDQITARSGVSKATVYAHFKSKDDLLLAVVDDMLRAIRAAVTDLPRNDDFRTWLAQLGRLASRLLTTPAAIALQRLAIAEAARFPQIARALHETGGSAVFAPAVIPEFEAAIAEGILRQSDPKVAHMHFFEMCLGKMLRDVLMGLSPVPGRREIDANVHSAVEAFLHGYAATRA